MLTVLRIWQLFLTVVAASASSPTSTRRWIDSSFVTAQDGHFYVNGKVFNFLGTNAYWLPALNTEDDIDQTLASIRQANFTVVRTWAFNDVVEEPVNGTWFQTICNGTAKINDGPNGLQKLDTVVKLAKKHGIYLLLSLTNNWNPSSTPGAVTPKNLSRNVLSNDYGGMDLYVRQLGDVQEHDQFYVNETILNAFKNYTNTIVSRYANESNVFAWELANDPRCNSTLPAAPTCDTLTVTKWHSHVAQYVQSIDPNHLVSSGSQGFFCADCPKLFPRTVPPPPQPSPRPGGQRRSVAPSVTKARLIMERKLARKQEAKRNLGDRADGISIRGQWLAPRQAVEPDMGIGSAFDGSYGVDSEDISNIPQIGFSSFQLFPDQETYSSFNNSVLPSFNLTLEVGVEWIRQHAKLGKAINKPVFLIGFGLVTQGNAPYFVPFNSSVSPFGLTQGNASLPYGVTDQQRDDAYSRWIEAGVSGGLRGLVQYQWSQDNLTAQPGTAVIPNQNQSGTSPNQNESGVSPNDGYGILGQGEQVVIGQIQSSAPGFATDPLPSGPS